MEARIDPKDAVRLRKRTKVIVSWYHSSTGSRFAAGIVKKSRNGKVSLLVLVPYENGRIVQMRINNHRLTAGKQEYCLYYPGTKEVESINRLFDVHQSKKLGWRWSAKKRFTLLSDWRFWAFRRILEISRCKQ